MWGALCEKRIKKIHNNNNETYIIPDDCILHEIKPLNDNMTTFKVSKMQSQYKSGFARMAPFLLAKGRTKISKIIEPYKNICVRCHTDSMNLIELPTDIKLGDQLGDLVYEGFFTP